MDLECLIFFVTCFVVYTAGQSNPPARFYLTNPKKPEERKEVDAKFTGVKAKTKTILITHGFYGDIDAPYMTPMAREFHKKGPHNVILVDWREIASNLYFAEKEKTKFVGRYIGEFLIKMNKQAGIGFDLMHLVGSSLGAHVMGFAGKTVKENETLIARITGLDPANPGFAAVVMSNKDHRLSKDDAAVVVVLHTDGGGFGIMEPIGSVDFYANCGTREQPPCRGIDIFNILNTITCSHGIATDYFVESINRNKFIGKKCARAKCFLNSCNKFKKAVFGPDTPAKVTGIYHFKTRSKKPYGKGKFGIKNIFFFF